MTVALQAQTFTKDQCVTGLRVAVGILEKWRASSDQELRLQALNAQPVLIRPLVMGEEAPWPWDDNERCYLNCPWDLLQSWKPELIDEGYMIAMGYSLAGHVADTGLPLTRSSELVSRRLCRHRHRRTNPGFLLFDTEGSPRR